MALKRVPRRGSSFPFMKQACSCLLGTILLLSSLILLTLSILFRKCKIVFIVWALLVTIGQVMDLLKHYSDDSTKDPFQFSDLIFPHRKFFPQHSHPFSSVSTSTGSSHQQHFSWKDIVRCNNHTNFTTPQWMNQNPLEINPVCQSEFIKPNRLKRSAKTPSVNLKKPVHVFIVFGDSAMVSDSTLHSNGDSAWDASSSGGQPFPHLYNSTSLSPQIQKGVRLVGISRSGAVYRNEWLGENNPAIVAKDSYSAHSTISPGAGGIAVDPAVLALGYLLRQALPDETPILVLQVDTTPRSPPPRPYPHQPQPQPQVRTITSTTSKLRNHHKSRPSPSRTPSRQKGGRLLAEAGPVGVLNVQRILRNIQSYYPQINHNRYKVAGILFWNIIEPSVVSYTSSDIETHLVQTIQEYRTKLDAPKANVVLAARYSSTPPSLLNDASFSRGKHDRKTRLEISSLWAISGDAQNYPAFRGNLVTVNVSTDQTSPVASALEMGTAMGWAMTRLIRRTESMQTV